MNADSTRTSDEASDDTATYAPKGQLSQLTHPDGQYLRYVNDRLGRTSEVWRDIANDDALRHLYPGGTAAPA